MRSRRFDFRVRGKPYFERAQSVVKRQVNCVVAHFGWGRLAHNGYERRRNPLSQFAGLIVLMWTVRLRKTSKPDEPAAGICPRLGLSLCISAAKHDMPRISAEAHDAPQPCALQAPRLRFRRLPPQARAAPVQSDARRVFRTPRKPSKTNGVRRVAVDNVKTFDFFRNEIFVEF